MKGTGKMQKNVSQLKAGVILSYINLGIGSIIPMVYTPIMLRMLGQAEYGLYSLSTSIIGYLSLLNFGLGSTIVRYVTKYRVEKNKRKEEEIIGLFLLLYLVLAVLVIFGGVILSLCAQDFFGKGLTVSEIEKLKILILIMAANTAISFPISVFSSVIIAHERYIFSRCVDILSTIISPFSNIIMLYLGYGSVGMAMVSVIIQFIMFPLYLSYCLKKLSIKPVWNRPESVLLKEIFGFSVFIFIGTIVDMLFWATDKVILGALTGTVTVAIYNVGSTFNSIIEKLSTTISGVLAPRITEMVVKNASKSELTDLFVKIGRIQFLIIGLVTSGFITFGYQFIIMWAGSEYGESYSIALLTMLPLVVPLIQTVGKNIVIAQNRHQFRAIVYLIIAIVNVISTYLIVPYMGAIGAALCSCISYIAGQGVIMNIYYYKVTGIDILMFWKNILKMAVVPGILILFFRYIIIPVFNFYNWGLLLIGIISYTALYGILMFFLIMNEYEQNLILKPFRIVLRKVRGR